ncbi:MAG: hypothetical protein EBU84_06115 [Actinobacteria bacterium]|nr:hypothetical protein [Actinomycetota bacterium]
MTVGRTWAPIVASLIIVLVSSGIRWLDSLGLTILLGAFVVSGLKLTRSLIGLIDEISRGLIGFFLVMVISGVISQLLTPKLSGIVSWLIFPLIVLLIAFIRFPFQDRYHDMDNFYSWNPLYTGNFQTNSSFRLVRFQMGH